MSHVGHTVTLCRSVALAACVYAALLQENVQRTFHLMSARGMVKPGELVVVVSDLRNKETDITRSILVRTVQ